MSAGGPPGADPHADDDAVHDHLHTLTRQPEEVRRDLERWLARHVPDPSVSPLSLPEGNGVSSDTVLFDAEWEVEGVRTRRRCVARLQPPASSFPVFPAYDLPKQAAVMRLARSRSGAPVPEVLWEEPDPRPLGTPFFVMERVDGRVPPDVMPYPFGSWLSEAEASDRRRLQDGAVGVVVALHAVDTSPEVAGFLDPGGAGATVLRRHVDHTAGYYRWVASGGAPSPLLERGFAWLEDHWPAHEGPTVLSWGDSRIGNMIFQGFDPAAVLDWEMAALGPREIDLSWMVFLHRFLDDLALGAGLPGMPGFMHRDDVATTYEAGSGHAPRDLDFYGVYAAVLMGVVILREQQRPLLQQGLPLPEDIDSLILHRDALEAMLAGTYWQRF